MANLSWFAVGNQNVISNLGSLTNSFDWNLENENINMEEKFGLTIQKAQPLHVVPIAI